MTPFQLHCDSWANGCGAEECSQASRRVLYKGSVPCDVLFIGKAPGESENVLGYPFAGPAGKLLAHIVSQSIPADIEVGYTNIVGCIPRDGSSKATEPTYEQTQACRPRLQEMVNLAAPKLVVSVGKLAREGLQPGMRDNIQLPSGTLQQHMVHPADILRSGIASRGMEIQRCIVDLREAIEHLRDPKPIPIKNRATGIDKLFAQRKKAEQSLPPSSTDPF